MKKTLLDNAFDIDLLLETKYEEHYVSNPISPYLGYVQGLIDDKPIVVAFEKDEYLLFSTDSDNREFLEELKPIFTKVMDGVEPFCSYDLVKDDEIVPTLEWNLVEPEERLKKIMESKAFNDGSKCLNIKLLNDENISRDIKTKVKKLEGSNI